MHVPPPRQLARHRLLRVAQLARQPLRVALAAPRLLLALLVEPQPRLVEQAERPARRAVERAVVALGLAADGRNLGDGLRGPRERAEDGLDVGEEGEEGGEEDGVRGGLRGLEAADVDVKGGEVGGREEGERGEGAGEDLRGVVQVLWGLA